MIANENKTKTIYIKYPLDVKKNFELEVESSIKDYELKKKIENKLGITIHNHLKLKKAHGRNSISLTDENRTLDECRIKNGDEIIIDITHNRGGGPDEFSNLSKEFIRKDEVLSSDSKNVPAWRGVGPGINLYGICEQENCVANGKQVIMHVYSNEFDVIKESFMGICPMCHKHFDLDTCSFFKCDYKTEGTYFDKKKDEWVDLPGEIENTSDGKDFYFDYKKVVQGKDGKVKYKKLILKVVRYHDENDK